MMHRATYLAAFCIDVVSLFSQCFALVLGSLRGSEGKGGK